MYLIYREIFLSQRDNRELYFKDHKEIRLNTKLDDIDFLINDFISNRV